MFKAAIIGACAATTGLITCLLPYILRCGVGWVGVTGVPTSLATCGACAVEQLLPGKGLGSASAYFRRLLSKQASFSLSLAWSLPAGLFSLLL